MPNAAPYGLFLRRDELQGRRVHAVAQAGRFGAVVEDVTEVSVAPGADGFDAGHAVAGVPVFDDGLLVHRLPEGRPARAAVELGVRSEEGQVATGAVVRALRVVVPVLARKRPLGPLLAQDVKLVRRQHLAPFGVALHHFGEGQLARLRGRGGLLRRRRGSHGRLPARLLLLQTDRDRAARAERECRDEQGPFSPRTHNP
jgi:hypothetical protein